MLEGGCRCGAIRYRASGEPRHHAICHCRDCQMASGAPMVACLAMPEAGFALLAGEPGMFAGSAGALRYFCTSCGTPLYYRNPEFLPGLVDLNTVTLDEPDAFAPTIQIQVAERRRWAADCIGLPQFERFPPQPE